MFYNRDPNTLPAMSTRHRDVPSAAASLADHVIMREVLQPRG